LKLNSIELYQFRSYQQQRFTFEPAGNLIIGANGSGKTNLLEAIAYTSMGKSIRFHQDKELIKNSEEQFSVLAMYETDLKLALKIQLVYDASRKILKINDEIKRQLSTLFADVKVIYCAPDDIGLVNGSPRQRRQYFDLAISQVYPEYIGILRDFLHIVEQRNKLLKSEFQLNEKKSWDRRFAQSLVALYPYRKKYLGMLNDELGGSFRNISENTRDLRLTYVPVLRRAMELSVDELMAQIEQYESREKLWQRSLIGAHLDDYSFRMGEFGMRAYASQGQKRIAVVIMKMIQAQLIESNTGIKPILLFDDVFAELDYQHGEKIHELCRDSYQIFIASPKEDVRQIFGKMNVIRLGNSA
jgi:DNA replication and repair protein RecF